jgi:hypothetical protein
MCRALMSTLVFSQEFLAGASCLTRACSRRAPKGHGVPLGPQSAVSALWNVGLCGGRLEGPQLMRMSLSSSTS